MKILFWGTPAYAVPSLEALVAAGHELVGVVSQPDRRRGRGAALMQLPADQIDRKSAMLATPALIKGYLRLGARVLVSTTRSERAGPVTDTVVVVPVVVISVRA